MSIWKNEIRDKSIFKLREDGWIFRKIAEKYKISPARVRFIYVMTKYKLYGKQ